MRPERHRGGQHRPGQHPLRDLAEDPGAQPGERGELADGYQRPGSTLKVNLALRGLPKFTCLPEDRGQYGPTIHLLPDEKDVMRHIKEGFAMVQRGELDPFPTIEWYIHTTVDPSLKDDAGNHNSALFVQWVPYATPIERLYSCSAGCHPAGSVIGAAGHNAARRVMRELGA